MVLGGRDQALYLGLAQPGWHVLDLGEDIGDGLRGQVAEVV